MASRRSTDDEFLRYHWIIYTNEYKESDIHRSIKTKIRLKDDKRNRIAINVVSNQITDYIESLKEASDIFLELNQPDSKTAFSDVVYSSYDKSGEIRDSINKFHRLRNIATFYPLFISARRSFKDKPDYFLTILRLAEIFTFRVYVIGNRRSDAGQAAFFRLAYDLYLQKDKNDRQKLAKFNEIKDEMIAAINYYGQDENFKTNLTQTNFYRETQVHEIKYFFYELERHKAKEAKENFDISWEDIERRAQVEHIWPQTPRGYEKWSDGKKRAHSNYVHRIGNLTITGWNQKLANKDFWDTEDFTGKRGTYKKSNLRVQRELAEYDHWGRDTIEQREGELVRFSLNRWRYDNF